MGAFVYMLRCADGSYYVGSARGDDLAKRVSEHQMGLYEGYTSRRRPVVLVYHEHFGRITDAIAAERRIKGWSRAKKEAFIRGDWTQIQWLAKRPSSRERILRKAQEEAAELPSAIETEIADRYELTDDDRAAIKRGLDAVRRGDIATDEEVKAVFDKYRRS
jgi:putative endonuclease